VKVSCRELKVSEYITSIGNSLKDIARYMKIWLANIAALENVSWYWVQDCCKRRSLVKNLCFNYVSDVSFFQIV
jgi:hypothetical protein